MVATVPQTSLESRHPCPVRHRHGRSPWQCRRHCARGLPARGPRYHLRYCSRATHSATSSPLLSPAVWSTPPPTAGDPCSGLAPDHPCSSFSGCVCPDTPIEATGGHLGPCVRESSRESVRQNLEKAAEGISQELHVVSEGSRR